MGCHTWAYKKLSACTKTEKDNFFTKLNEIVKDDIYNCSLEEYIDLTKKTADVYIKHAEKYGDIEEIEGWKQYSNESAAKKRWLKENKKLQQFKNGITLENVIDYCKTYHSCNYKIISGEVYISLACDSPFRVFGYPENTFKKKNAILKWLKTTDKKFGYYDENGFVDGFTEGLVNEINEFFNIHGENNLFFHFG